MTAHQFYYQPTLLPLADQPEFQLAPGKKQKKLKDEWVTTYNGEFTDVELGETNMKQKEDEFEEKKEKKGKEVITESSPLAERPKFEKEEGEGHM